MPSAFFPSDHASHRPGGPPRRRIVRQLHPVLTNVLNRLEGTALGPAFKDRAVEVSTSKVLGETVDHAAALTAHLWLLEHADGEGLPLTAAGYLKPAAVKELAAVMPVMDDWIFAIGREIDAFPMLHFREYLKQIGLLRKYRGTLRLTRHGRAGLQDAAVLWRHLAAVLVPDGDDFDTYAGVVTLVHAATSEGEPDLDVIARTMTALGWVHRDDSPVTRRDIHPVWNQTWDALGNVGERVAGEYPSSRVLSGPSRILVDAALFTDVEAPPPHT